MENTNVGKAIYLNEYSDHLSACKILFETETSFFVSVEELKDFEATIYKKYENIKWFWTKDEAKKTLEAKKEAQKQIDELKKEFAL